MSSASSPSTASYWRRRADPIGGGWQSLDARLRNALDQGAGRAVLLYRSRQEMKVQAQLDRLLSEQVIAYRYCSDSHPERPRSRGAGRVIALWSEAHIPALRWARRSCVASVVKTRPVIVGSQVVLMMKQMLVVANLLAALAAPAAAPASASETQRCESAALTPKARAGLTAVFMDDESSPATGRFLWAYTVRVENTGTGPLQLIGRCWEIQGEGRPVVVYAGEGLVGQTPRLEPGTAHEYTSWAPLPVASGSIRGHVVAVDSAGRLLRIPVAEVRLQMPLHPVR